MKLLLPLGLIGLLGVVAWIIIYIIRPVYQKKLISSTFIWKLSLKKNKRKLPINKLRNILLIICQLCFLTCVAFAMAQPARVLKERIDDSEVIIVMDNSASMNTFNAAGVTRRERMVDEVKKFADETLSQGGIVSLISAGSENKFIATRVTKDKKDDLSRALEEFSASEDIYSAADLNGAVALSEEVYAVNPDAALYVYTDDSFLYVPEGVTVVNVADSSEWNVAILNAYAEMEDNYYNFYVEIACYGERNLTATLDLDIAGPKPEVATGNTITYTKQVYLNANSKQTVIFRHVANELGEGANYVFYDINPTERVYSFQSVYAHIDMQFGEEDSLPVDDSFFIYGGEKQELRVEYASSMPNTFVYNAINSVANALSGRYDLKLKEVEVSAPNAYNVVAPIIEGYDFYIFEHTMPATMPTDGVVILLDPDVAPIGSGIRLGDVYTFGSLLSMPMSSDAEHAILRNVFADNITVSKFTRITSTDPNYVSLLSCRGDSMLLVKDADDAKVVVMPFSLHYSNLPILAEFPLLFKNIFNYFLPSTINGNVYEVNSELTFFPSGSKVTSVTADKNAVNSQTIDKFPSSVKLTSLDSYSIIQQAILPSNDIPESKKTLFQRDVREHIFVKTPTKESDIFAVQSSLNAPRVEVNKSDYYKDLLFYLAIALTVLLFAEWLLHTRSFK